LLLLDASQLEASDSSVDYWAMKAVTYLAELKAPRRRGWDRRPLAIVFTKADRSDVCRDNPRLFAEKRAPGLVKQCEQRLRCFEFFAASAVGASAVQRGLQSSIHIPLRVEPYGFVEPFAWLADF
jgi:hypothetical protein